LGNASRAGLRQHSKGRQWWPNCCIYPEPSLVFGGRCERHAISRRRREKPDHHFQYQRHCCRGDRISFLNIGAVWASGDSHAPPLLLSAILLLALPPVSQRTRSKNPAVARAVRSGPRKRRRLSSPGSRALDRVILVGRISWQGRFPLCRSSPPSDSVHTDHLSRCGEPLLKPLRCWSARWWMMTLAQVTARDEPHPKVAPYCWDQLCAAGK